MKAMAHIQKTAPGPPKAIAVATPAMLPVPTRPERAMDKAWNEETPASELLPWNIKTTISLICLTCRNRVKIENNKPTPNKI
jgi:hypothetical protein